MVTRDDVTPPLTWRLAATWHKPLRDQGSRAEDKVKVKSKVKGHCRILIFRNTFLKHRAWSKWRVSLFLNSNFIGFFFSTMFIQAFLMNDIKIYYFYFQKRRCFFFLKYCLLWLLGLSPAIPSMRDTSDIKHVYTLNWCLMAC